MTEKKKFKKNLYRILSKSWVPFLVKITVVEFIATNILVYEKL